MAWTWIRPRDPDVLVGRPLLDLGCGDGQTMAALVSPEGLVVGADRSLDALRAARRTVQGPLVAAEAARLPFADSTFAVVLAADLFHHLSDEALGLVLSEIERILGLGGRMVGWWVAQPLQPAPDAPRHTRSFDEARSLVIRAGFEEVASLELRESLESSSTTTVALTATSGATSSS